MILMSPVGSAPGYAADEIFAALREHAKQGKHGRAVGDNKAFRIHLPNRELVKPNAAYYLGPSTGMDFYDGAPVFAVDVRNEEDYGESAEEELAQRRADLFAAGTLVVWDVDLVNKLIRVYRTTEPDTPAIYRRGEIAEAAPAIPGWKFPVDNIFDSKVNE